MRKEFLQGGVEGKDRKEELLLHPSFPPSPSPSSFLRCESITLNVIGPSFDRGNGEKGGGAEWSGEEGGNKCVLSLFLPLPFHARSVR